jgi:predicted Zn finger-like uncharacterized protein
VKFLCDQCKAKYQIADEKVAGKTVRMKCRKCGHMIEVRAAVTETSVSVEVPREDNPAADGLAGQAGLASTAPMPAPKPSPPKPTGSALATSFASARPVGSRPPLSAQTRPETGLSNAFHKAVQKDDDALDMLELHAADEWYVAINGVPVGPVRMTELRRKAATGAVTEDSLVWQEGLEEWRPVKAISELAMVVREAIAGGRVSLATPPPGEARISAPPPAPRAPMGSAPGRPLTSPAFAPPRPTPHPPAPMPLAAARNNVVPITGRGGAGALATAERLEAPHASPFTVPAPTPAPDPFALPPAAAAPIPSPFVAPATPSIVPPQQKKSPPWIAIAMVVLAGAFGITAAIIVLTRPAQQPVVIQMPSAQPTTTAAPPPLADDVPAPDPGATAVAATGADGGPGRTAAMHGGPRNGGAGTSAPPAPTNSAIAALLGGNGVSGPTPGGPAAAGGGSGSQLSSDQIEGVVKTHQAGMKRTCYERIATDKTGTVQITVNATVGGNGQVQSVSANGNDPTIAKCIEGAVRGWVFPATGATSQIQIPFKFVRQ